MSTAKWDLRIGQEPISGSLSLSLSVSLSLCLSVSLSLCLSVSLSLCLSVSLSLCLSVSLSLCLCLSRHCPFSPRSLLYFLPLLRNSPVPVSSPKSLVAPYCAIPRDYLSDTPLLRAMGFLGSQHGQLGAIPPPPFLSISPVESMRSGGAIPPPLKGVSQRYLRDTL